MRLPLVLSLALVVAGCVGAPVDTAAIVDAPAPTTSADVVAYRAGAPIDLATLGEPVEAALYALGASAFEPTLGVDADGTLFYAAYAGSGPVIGVEPAVLRSDDKGVTWTDVSPRVGPLAMPPETNDPFLYVDPDTGRVFQFAMAPILVCAVLSYSDDKGESWTTNPRGCGNAPPWDHQSMVAAHPRIASTPAYPNVLVQCVNNVVAMSSCSRSLDGGLTWSVGGPAFVEPNCGGLHGHPVAHPDGTVFLPKMSCGVPELAYTEDDGLTWTVVKVADAGHPWPDPAMAVDSEGNVFFAWTSEKGEMLLSVSTDVGRTWSEPAVASPPGVTAHLPALAAGDAGQIVIAYPGTPDLSEGYDSAEDAQNAALWHGYLTIVTDALAAQPTFVTARVNDLADPLVRGPCGPGRCPGMIDFIDVVVGPDGRPYASFVDACSDECAADSEGENDQSAALLATLLRGPLLRAPTA